MITPSLVWEHLDFNLDNPLFTDVNVRRAIAMGIDCQSIVSTALKGVAIQSGSDQFPLSWAYNQQVKVTTRDMNAAKELLIQAGWVQGPDGVFAKNGTRLSFVLTTTEGNKVRETVAQMIVQQLKEIGIEVQVKLVDSGELFDRVLKTRHFEVAMYAWVLSLDPDDTNFWHSRVFRVMVMVL